jgi:SAM-dependent methyltransferase
MKKLNVGCGLDVRAGWVNLDQFKAYGADVIFDLNKIYKGKKLPFKNNTFDYVYCSHVLEDFIDPVPIIDELIRVCKINGLIEIRTPFETNVWNTNMYHKKAFTLGMFANFSDKSNYNKKRDIKIVELKYYCIKGKKHINFIKFFVERFYNNLPYQLVEHTFLKYLFPIVNCKVIYQKIDRK